MPGQTDASIQGEKLALSLNVELTHQTMYELCKTELYDDCLVGDIDTFAQDIESNPQKTELLAQIKTLRVYQGDQLLLKEPTYARLVSDSDEWRILGTRVSTLDEYGALKLAVQDDEYADRFLSGPACRSLQSASLRGGLAKLERVTMTREAESFQWGVLQEEFDTFNGHLDPAPLPFFLANLPGVAHYCQWSPTGPLAFPNQTIQIDNPPKIVTIMLQICLRNSVLFGLPSSCLALPLGLCSMAPTWYFRTSIWQRISPTTLWAPT